MNREIHTIPAFDKELKRLVKKHKSLKNDYNNFLRTTAENGIQGVALGNGMYKARIAISSKARGKSGGARIISYLEAIVTGSAERIYFVAIYDKSEFSTISTSKLKQIIEDNLNTK